MSKVLEQTACLNPDCGSSDALTIYLQDDGKEDAYCFSCGSYFKDPRGIKAGIANDEVLAPNGRTASHYLESSARLTTPPANPVGSIEEALAHPIRELKERGISFSTAEKYGVRIGVDTRDGVSPTYYLFPVHKNGDLTGFVKKTFLPKKSYLSIGDCKQADLFGLNVIPQKGKKLFITEGQEDCLSVYQVLKENSTINWDPAVVALCGSEAKLQTIAKHMDFMNNYDEIILVLDNDHAGKEASKKIAKMLAGKVYICTLPGKDPSDMLQQGKGEQLKWAVLTGAKKYQPDGIVNAKDMWDRYESTDSVDYVPFPPCMPNLNKKMYGPKFGTVMTVTGGTSIGKTHFMRELKYHFLDSTEEKIADIELEADVTETLKSLVGLKLNKRITLPDVKADKEEEYEAFESLFGTGRYTLYDYFGGMDDDSLFSKLRYFAATGHRLIFLDHLSIIVSEYASEGGERERIDTIMTKLAKLAKETGVCIILVVHLKYSNRDGIPFELGAIPTVDDLRGSSSIKQLSWDIISLSRNTQHPDPYCATVTELTSLKCRLTGSTGSADFVKFDENTGRYINVPMPPNYRVKKDGNSNRDSGKDDFAALS